MISNKIVIKSLISIICLAILNGAKSQFQEIRKQYLGAGNRVQENLNYVF